MNDKVLPKPVVGKTWWPFPLIWLIPLFAAVAAAYYLYDYVQSRGPEIVIRFEDANGIKPGQTPVQVHGVMVGRVVDLKLSGDGQGVDVKVRMERGNGAIARKGTRFWIVRPDFSAGNLSGLSTVVSGPHIDAAIEGSEDEPATSFVGLQRAPVTMDDGLRVIIHATEVGTMQPNTPVMYRGIQVGMVEKSVLADNATHVRVQAFIEKRYAPLIRENTRFWNVSGASVEGSIFSGVHARLDSFKSLITGGLAFATPDDEVAPPAREMTEFFLYDKPDEKWRDWTPKIPLGKPDEGKNGLGQEPGREPRVLKRLK